MIFFNDFCNNYSPEDVNGQIFLTFIFGDTKQHAES